MQRLNLSSISFAAVFDKLWFREEQPLTLGVFRILLGLFLILHFAVNCPNWNRFFGPESIIPLSDESRLFSYTALSLFAHCDHSSLWILYWVGVISALLFTIGYGTRLSCIMLYVILNSCKLRNPWVMEGSEHVLIVVLFVLMVAPIGESFSLSTWLKSRTQPELWPGGRARPVWTLWLLRVFLSIVYYSSVFHKLFDSDQWRSGKVMYNILLWERHSRLISIDIIHEPWFTSISTYGSLLVEGVAPVLIWFRAARPWVALSLVFLHLGIMVMLTSATELFNLLMICMMVLLIDNDQMMVAWKSRSSRGVRKFCAKIFLSGGKKPVQAKIASN